MKGAYIKPTANMILNGKHRMVYKRPKNKGKKKTLRENLCELGLSKNLLEHRRHK